MSSIYCPEHNYVNIRNRSEYKRWLTPEALFVRNIYTADNFIGAGFFYIYSVRILRNHHIFADLEKDFSAARRFGCAEHIIAFHNAVAIAPICFIFALGSTFFRLIYYSALAVSRFILFTSREQIAEIAVSFKHGRIIAESYSVFIELIADTADFDIAGEHITVIR